MYTIVWSFVVKPGREAEFEEHYGAAGTWASLFEKGSGFVKTELVRDAPPSRRYVTIDTWQSKEDFERFAAANHEEYARIDAMCEELTEREDQLAASEITALPLHREQS